MSETTNDTDFANWNTAKFSNSDDDDSDSVPPPTGKRLAPVGANEEDDRKQRMLEDATPPPASASTASASAASAAPNAHGLTAQSSVEGGAASAASEVELFAADGEGDDDAGELKRRIREMEEEQEELNTSLMGMTSHFAKVK